jgi:thiamine-phosphate pyrophosphorylase
MATAPSRCSIYLITPPLSGRNANAFARDFGAVLAGARIASALVRLAPGAGGEAKAIIAPLLRAAIAADCALLIEDDARLAARLGADGVHIAGANDDLLEAIKSLKPERIVGAGSLRTRDDAMAAGEAGADYVMFGEPAAASPAMPLELLTERVGWWAEIFETPCVAYAETIEAAGALARAGADFVALDEAIWSAPSPVDATRSVDAVLQRIVAEAQ